MVVFVIALFTAAKVVLAHFLVFGGPGTALSLLLDLLFVAVLMGIGALLPRPAARYAWALVCAAVLSILMFATSVYASYFEQVMGVAAVKLTGQAGAVGGSIVDLLKPIYLLYVVDIPVLVWLSVRAARLEKLREVRSGRREKLCDVRAARLQKLREVRIGRTVRVGSMVTLLAVCVALCLTVRTLAVNPGTLDGLMVSRARGLFTYQLATGFHHEHAALAVSLAGGTPHLKDAAWVASAINGLKGASATPDRLYSTQPAAAKGANVIIIQVEALQAALVGKSIDGVSITPNLNALCAESWYFPHMFSQISGGNTADAEFISNTSLYPPADDAASIADVDKQLPSLPRLLDAAGYRSVTFHVNAVSFWNRVQLYPALGFDRYYDQKFFGNVDRIGFGSSDEELFKRGAVELQRMSSQGQPFYAQFVTASSHFPFTQIPALKHAYEPPAPYAGTEIGRYITAENYTDRAIGQFLDELKADGLYDSSVIVVYGDHFGMRQLAAKGAEGAAQHALFGREYTDVDRLNIPLIVHVPKQDFARSIASSAGQIDIMPTVADLLDIDITKTPHFGRSLFADSPVMIGERRFVPAGSVITADTYLAVGLTSASSKAIALDGRAASRSVNTAEAKTLRTMSTLLTLSDAYIDALPKLPDYKPASGPLDRMDFTGG